jgi:RHS repeat-associated protein
MARQLFLHSQDTQRIFTKQNDGFAEEITKNYSILCDFFVLFVVKDSYLNFKALFSRSTTLSMPNMVVSYQISSTERKNALWELMPVDANSYGLTLLRSYGLLYMNGRLYDPVIARFFSPDMYVANSSFTQDFNRYSYARNCPLMYTDPSGEIAEWAIALIAIAASAILSATSYTVQVAASPGGFQNWSWDDFGANMMMGVGNGLITAGIGGAFGPVVAGWSMANIFNELGRAGAHAVVGGMFSYANGGKFWPNATSSFASSLVGSAADGFPALFQIGASTLFGGMTSEMTGGTFWEGAVNGLMISILNHTLHGIIDLMDVNRTGNHSSGKFLWSEGMPTVMEVEGEIYVVPVGSDRYDKLSSKELRTQFNESIDKKPLGTSRFHPLNLRLSPETEMYMKAWAESMNPLPSLEPPYIFRTPNSSVKQNAIQKLNNDMIYYYRKELIIR